MKSFSALLVLFLISISSMNCIEVNTLVTLNKDGSGILSEKVLLSKEAFNLISEFAAAFQDTSDKSAFDPFTETELIENTLKYGEGVAYLHSERISHNGKRGYKASYSFPDISKLKLDQDLSNKAPLNVEEVSKHTGNSDKVTFEFKRGNVSKLIINFAPDTIQKSANRDVRLTDEDSVDADLDFQEDVYDLLKGLKFRLALEFNGRIIETNASYIKGNQLILFDIDFDELLTNKEALTAISALELTDMDRVKELLKSIPGIKIESKEKIKVYFE